MDLTKFETVHIFVLPFFPEMHDDVIVASPAYLNLFLVYIIFNQLSGL